MDGAIEGIVLCENEENNKGHIDMVRISVFNVVKDLQDGHNLRETRKKMEKRFTSCLAF